MKRTLRYVFGIYLIGAALVAIYLVWSAIDGGALERHHDARGWLRIALFYLAASAFWPVDMVIFLLQYFGIMHRTLELPHWLLPLAALALMACFIGFAFRQGMKVKRENNPDNWPPSTGDHPGI